MAKVVEESFGSPNPQSKATAISETDNTVFDFVDTKRSKASAFQFFSGHFFQLPAPFHDADWLLERPGVASGHKTTYLDTTCVANHNVVSVETGICNQSPEKN